MEEETTYQLYTNEINVSVKHKLGIFWRLEAYNQLNRTLNP